MNKEHLKKQLIELQSNLIKELQEKTEYSHSMVDIDEDDVRDPDDYSRQWESGEIEQLMKVQLNKAKGCLTKLNSIDFSPKNKVTQGAFVETDKLNFFIGLSTIPFDFDDKEMVGISEESPIYAIMAGKEKGYTFSFSGNTYTITNIY